MYSNEEKRNLVALLLIDSFRFSLGNPLFLLVLVPDAFFTSRSKLRRSLTSCSTSRFFCADEVSLHAADKEFEYVRMQRNR